MRAAYSTNEHGNSQWQTFSNLPSTEWADCSFEYDIKDALPRNDDYVAFQGDGSNGIVYIDDVKIELKYDYPKGIVRTNTDGSLAGIKLPIAEVVILMCQRLRLLMDRMQFRIVLSS